MAQSWRKEGNLPEAVRIWHTMVTRKEGGVLPLIELAKYYEHKEKDVQVALSYTRQAIALLSEVSIHRNVTVQSQKNALEYRYQRLIRKLSKSP